MVVNEPHRTRREPGSYIAYNLHNFRAIPEIQNLGDDVAEAIEVVGRVLPIRRGR